MKRYGMSQHEFDTQLLKQKGFCAVCELLPATDVDHNHVTVDTREILCSRCNTGLGYMENATWKAKAESYLDKHSLERVCNVRI
jgi:Recombination endonuclease VII